MMRRLSFLCILLLIWAHAAGAQTITTIKVNESGDALWTVEKHLSLTTQAEINEWEGFIQNGTHIYRYNRDIEEFNQKINRSLRSAKNYSNRTMEIENFNISYDTVRTLPNAFGIVRVNFDWINFSRISEDKILIGDVFSEGMVLSSDNVLIIDIPEGYETMNASPRFDKQDVNRLIWDGTMYRSMGKGEPTLVLSPIPPPPTTEDTDTSFIMVVGSISLVIIVIIVVLWIYLKKKDEITEPENNNVPTPLPDLTEEDLRDEEMVEQILVKSGGQAYQSNIVRESGFSKSKISILLAQMKEEGRIIKIRKGKENLIRLVGK